jgi:WD40 repeat protein
LELKKTWKADGFVKIMASREILLACGNSDGSIRVFHMENFYLTHKFKSHTASVLALTFHPNEYILVSAALDYTVKIFDLVRYTCLQTVKVFEGNILGLGFQAPDKLTVTSIDGGVKILAYSETSKKI